MTVEAEREQQQAACPCSDLPPAMPSFLTPPTGLPKRQQCTCENKQKESSPEQQAVTCADEQPPPIDICCGGLDKSSGNCDEEQDEPGTYQYSKQPGSMRKRRGRGPDRAEPFVCFVSSSKRVKRWLEDHRRKRETAGE